LKLENVVDDEFWQSFSYIYFSWFVSLTSPSFNAETLSILNILEENESSLCVIILMGESSQYINPAALRDTTVKAYLVIDDYASFY
jgi:hypothetical protein